MPSGPFRNPRGQYSPGMLSTPGDIKSKLLFTEDHWLIPPWAPKPWRLKASGVRGIEHLFPEGAKPTVRVILWALHHGQAPRPRPRPVCGQRACVNPLHQEQVMSLSHEVCYSFFAEAYEALSKGQRFAITLPDEGKATTYRFQLHRWRNDNRQELPEGYGEIIIKIRPAPVIESVSAFEDGGPPQPFVLYAELDRDDELFLSSMQEALGREVAQAPSAVELLNSIKETTDENDNHN